MDAKTEADDRKLSELQTAPFITISCGQRVCLIAKPATYGDLNKAIHDLFFLPSGTKFRIYHTPRWMTSEVEIGADALALIANQDSLRIALMGTVVVEVQITTYGVQNYNYIIDSWSPLAKLLDLVKNTTQLGLQNDRIALWYDGIRIGDFDTPETLKMAGGGSKIEVRKENGYGRIA
ncbi:hypothetical protein CkaCkLH20_10633 [Colletotrichum karsti]|uniref:Uncharacterized protein n=1 Tax=Colletotrichum karsti TaxID=1095194 RepID=A0A9P6I0Y6_9PEZI|nr:uncharacterized protein CkaCkLH20_10633 [Colletotrichum karsti]KAF9872001.1 hypothetical protein CkaCkLH20_10633 [Colletotrichum karsti]